MDKCTLTICPKSDTDLKYGCTGGIGKFKTCYTRIRLKEEKESVAEVPCSDGLEGLCGCGKPVRYMIGGTEGACNRYMRCLTYEDLIVALVKSNETIHHLRTALESIAEQEGATAIGAQAEGALSKVAD